MFLHGGHCLCIPATDKLRKKITTKNASNLGQKSERCLFPQECPEKRAMAEYLLCGTRLRKSYKIAMSSVILSFFKKLRSLSYNIASDFNAKKKLSEIPIPWAYHDATLILCAIVRNSDLKWVNDPKTFVFRAIMKTTHAIRYSHRKKRNPHSNAVTEAN